MYKKIFLILVFVLLPAIGIVAGVFLTQQPQDIRQHAADTAATDALATVDNQPVTLSQLRALARRQYAEGAITQDVLQQMLDTVLEQRLLVNEAKKRGITVSQDAVSDIAQSINASGSANQPASVMDQAEYTALKEAITRAVATTRDAYTVGFWLPPENYGAPLTAQQQRTITQQREIRDKVLTQIQQQLSQGKQPLQVAESISNTYPILKPVLSVNGFILEKDPPETLLTKPVLYDYQQNRANNPFFATLFTMKEGEIKQIISKENSGGFVVKVTNATTGQYNSYADWLAASKQNRTHIIHKP